MASTSEGFLKLDPALHKDGHFMRPDAQFRNHISSSPGAEFPAEAGRYHLYVSYACPWAHRTLITRQLKGLESIIPFTAVHWELKERGWPFATPETRNNALQVVPDPYHPEAKHIRDIYFAEVPDYTGRPSVPVLYDTVQKRIVSNESSEIIRMFYHAFDHLLPKEYAEVELLPKDLEATIDEVNEWTYNDVNNGVYKSGIATTQQAYEVAVTALFSALDRIEQHLAAAPGPFYHGERLTEADIRLYPTIVRFDTVYVQHFKCNIRDVRSGYPAIHRWLRYCYWEVDAFRDTTVFEHIKKHYMMSHRMINPYGIVCVGPVPDIMARDEEVRAVPVVKKA
jgi:glutathionyl-hydroquinone reductase